MSDLDNLQSKKLPELQSIAEQLQVPKFRYLRKQQLIDGIMSASGSPLLWQKPLRVKSLLQPRPRTIRKSSQALKAGKLEEEGDARGGLVIQERKNPQTPHRLHPRRKTHLQPMQREQGKPHGHPIQKNGGISSTDNGRLLPILRQGIWWVL